jgi:CxxC-x17-CxxC domain-containing protein
MGNFNRDDNRAGGYRGGFSRGGGRGGFRGGRSSFGDSRGGDREMFSAICSNCGKECQVPFKPTNGKPVYCSDCFEKMGGRSDSRRSERTEFRPQAPGFDQSRAQLDAVNAKLDKILNLLQPKVEVPAISSPIVEKVVEEVKEIKTPKVKKTVKKVASKK